MGIRQRWDPDLDELLFLRARFWHFSILSAPWHNMAASCCLGRRSFILKKSQEKSIIDLLNRYRHRLRFKDRRKSSPNFCFKESSSSSFRSRFGSSWLITPERVSICRPPTLSFAAASSLLLKQDEDDTLQTSDGGPKTLDASAVLTKEL